MVTIEMPTLELAKDIIKTVYDIHNIVKHDTLKADEAKALLEFRDKLVNALKEL